ncbi:hypothetical protein RR46_10239 [Papilio xuthus]|uniref:Uncharacterized protein n=1 Tax=Papilio xuthus TaxID=66420 RepID=A0A194Q032_PAPXU|nr:hypothetical protein RR46_10239 [Papilio xuthus]
MAPVELQGNNLGEKHKYYNELLITAIKNSPIILSPIDFNDSDVNNMLKIDIACSRRDLNYVLDVLKCEDMLYVSKVIKKINWLINNEEYAHIINPQYLDTQLFPEMTATAKKKLLLYIRLNLKNETRVEEFFNHYKNINLKESLKWLPNCSSIFIENAVKTYKADISVDIMKRLCEKSIKFLILYLNSTNRKNCNNQRIMKETIFLMNNHLEKYLDILESLEDFEYPMFSPKYTKMLMKNAPRRVLNGFEKFAKKIHLQTLVKFMNSDDISNILLQDCKNSDLEYWFTENVLDEFLGAMPIEDSTQFVIRNVFDKINEEEHNFMLHAIPRDSYRWYKYVEFKTAFKEIVKLIKTESSPCERMMMMEILLYSAKNNMQHIEELLQYYRVNHINETTLYKKKFIMTIVREIDTFRLNDEAWDNLNVLFLSIADTESKTQEQCIIKVEIIRKIINNESVPEIIERKFNFETMKVYQKKLNKMECDLTFNYLYSYAMKQVNQQSITNEIEFQKAVILLNNVLLLLSDWKKDLANYPEVVKSITKLKDLKKTQFKDINLSRLYNANKSWKKCLFSMSLDLSLTQEVCINALKHDSKLLDSNYVMDLLARSDFTNLQKLLNKIRIYWPTTLANEAISFCLDNLNNRGDKALIKNLMYLLPINNLKEIVVKYIPNENKIDWHEDELLLNIRKNIAKYVHIARPQPPIEFILWYAKGDYLQFAVSSLNLILYNMKETKIRTCIQQLIDAPVSLKKHVIRIAINKLKYEEIIKLFRSAWKNTKIKSIRADLFKTTFQLLCKQTDVPSIEAVWALLFFFIESLTDTENTDIYNTLTKANKVPLSVKAEYWKRSVLFFKHLPSSSNQRSYLQKVLYSAKFFAEIVDTETLADIILENLKCDILSMGFDTDFIPTCILSTNTMKECIQRYDKIFLPMMETCVTYWDIKKYNNYIYREVFGRTLSSLCYNIQHVVLAKQMIIPDGVFNKILKYIEQYLPEEENYVLLRTWKFSYKLIEIIKLKSNAWNEMDRENLNDYYNIVISMALPQLGDEIQKCLSEDIKKYCPSIYICMVNAINLICTYFRISDCLSACQLLLKSILCPDLKESYLLVLELIPRLHFYNYESTRDIMDIISSHPSQEVKLHYYSQESARSCN